MAVIKETVRDELASVLADTLNKRFKENKVAYFLDGPEDSPADIKEWVSSGSSILDIAISNRPNGGVAVGRITEITGLESSGKSLLAAHMLKDTQLKGGVAVYIDTETSVSRQFLEAIGVDLNKMLYVPLDTVEDVFETIDHIIENIRSSDKDRLVTIVVDSVAAASTKIEMEADFQKDGYATSKAIIISKAMRKITSLIGRQRIALIFTNQLRQKMGVMFGDPWTTSGGKALAFHSSTRLRLKKMGQVKKKEAGIEKVIGIKCRAQVIKNRLGPPLRQADFEIYFDSGIRDYDSWLHVLKSYKLVKGAGAWYTIVDQNGKEIKFQSKEWTPMLKADPELYDFVYGQICDKMIMKYRENEDLGIDDVEIDENV